jgi:hypothetical protein
MITFEHTSGIGINANYRIRNAHGAVVATVARTGRSRWRIASVHYHHTLGTYGSLDRAREAAQALAYPTAKEVYDLICSEVGEHRRIEKVTAHRRRFRTPRPQHHRRVQLCPGRTGNFARANRCLHH